MSIFITRDVVDASDIHEYYTDASDIGITATRTGEFPRELTTDMGNGLPFLLWSVTQDVAIYRQSNGIIILRVFND